MKIYCIDDELVFLNKLKEFMIEYSIKKDHEIDVEFIQSIPDYIPDDADAYFVDILIDKQQIFDYVSKIREKDMKIPIIFFSNYDSFVFQSVKYNVFDFIRKKYLSDEFEPMMNRLINYSLKKEPTFVIKYNNNYKHIHASDVIYIESFSHTTIMHLINETIEIKKSIKDVLGNNLKLFCRIYRSYYINIQYLESLSKHDVILLGNIVLPIGKKYKKELENTYLVYLEKSGFL